MSVQTREQRWVEAGLGRIRVNGETVDYGNGQPTARALKFTVPGTPAWIGQQLGQPPPASFMLTLDEIRELLRLADEDPQALGLPETP